MARIPTPQTFMIAFAQGNQKQVEGYPFGITVGNVKHRFMVHRMGDGSWRVSCPVSGRRVTDLVAYVKGMPVHSGGLNAAGALQVARPQIHALVVKVGGEDAFNRVVLQARQQAEVSS